jgi:CubicO group peptidase (beta-lactamase class C family)
VGLNRLRARTPFATGAKEEFAMMTRRGFQTGLLLAASGSRAFSADERSARGGWSGVLDAGSKRLRLKLEIEEDGKARIFSLDQGGQPIPGRRMSRAVDQIEIEFPAIHAIFTGRLVGPDRMEGLWRQGVTSLQLAFERGNGALAPLAPPQPLTRERLAEIRAEAGSPALAAASARKGNSARVWVDGERAVGSGIAVQDTDQWHLGSITKSMTASLVARLVDAGALRWDETVGDVLGSVAEDMLDAYRPATFKHLLSHRAGLPKDLPDTEFVQFSRELADPREERQSFIRRALAMTPVGPMTTTFEYSNNGYVVAGAMLEAKLGRSWEDLIRGHLFSSLGLTTAGFGAPGRNGAVEQPVGHSSTANSDARRAHPVQVSRTIPQSWVPRDACT